MRIRCDPLPRPTSPSDEIDFRDSDEQSVDTDVAVQQPQKSLLGLVQTLFSGTRAKQGEAQSPPTPPAAGASTAGEAVSSDTASTTTSNEQQVGQKKRRRKARKGKRVGVQKRGENVQEVVEVPEPEPEVASAETKHSDSAIVQFQRVFSECQALQGQATIGHRPEGQLSGPHIHHALFKASSKGKGEDAWLIRSENEWMLNGLESLGTCSSGIGTGVCNFGVWGIFDGHGGRQVATFASNALIKELATLVQEPLPAEKRADLSKSEALVGTYSYDSEQDVNSWAAETELICRLPYALHQSFERCDQEARRRYAKSGGGTTATMAVAVGWELLLANVGDSLAYLDTGSEVLSLCVTHRLEDNASEVKRIEESGGEVACSTVDGKPAGPIRVWPGGLAMGRTLGDDEAGDLVPGTPALVQVTLPRQGARLVLGSDGLWDAINAKQAIHHVRSMQAEAAAHYLGAQAIKKDHLKDDVTVVVVDFCSSNSSRIPDGLVTSTSPNDKVVPWHPGVDCEKSKFDARIYQMIADHAQRREFGDGSRCDIDGSGLLNPRGLHSQQQTSGPGESVVETSSVDVNTSGIHKQKQAGLYEELAHMRLTPEDVAQALKSENISQESRRGPRRDIYYKQRGRKRQDKEKRGC